MRLQHTILVVAAALASTGAAQFLTLPAGPVAAGSTIFGDVPQQHGALCVPSARISTAASLVARRRRADRSDELSSMRETRGLSVPPGTTEQFTFPGAGGRTRIVGQLRAALRLESGGDRAARRRRRLAGFRGHRGAAAEPPPRLRDARGRVRISVPVVGGGQHVRGPVHVRRGGPGPGPHARRRAGRRAGDPVSRRHLGAARRRRPDPASRRRVAGRGRTRSRSRGTIPPLARSFAASASTRPRSRTSICPQARPFRSADR